MAQASTEHLDDARADVTAIRRIAAGVPADVLAGLNTGRDVLELGAKILEARISERARGADTIRLWEEAVALEDRLAYSEPAD
jgi:hypothetical protein